MSDPALSIERAQPAAPVTRSGARLRRRFLTLAAKRALDVLLAAALLAALVPVLALIALAIKLDSRGPVFFRVRRVGRGGRPFGMLKFRKMHDGARGGPLTVRSDPRLTRVGAILARSRLDELPQLWDVLTGRMSLIGPRPEDPGFVALHPDAYREILSVRPGITGLSQIAYREEAAIVDAGRPVDDYVERIMPQKLTMDRLYARRVSLTLDLRIAFWTLVTLLLGRPVSVNRVTGSMNIRRRPAQAAPGPPSAHSAHHDGPAARNGRARSLC
ncbi:MAG TPA: sugar transferase [Solirubrobacteraceae bacterium]|nr:sugar transferase [Solirubrobacteraceae bacterium]